jgi:hypothetical protein
MSQTFRHSHPGFSFFRSGTMALPPALTQRDIDRLARHTRSRRGQTPSVRWLVARLAGLWKQPRN